MKQFETLKKHLEWEKYYNPDFDWNDEKFYFYHEAFSEDFIREFQDKVNWDIISYHQTLSEDFIREFQDKVNWGNISEYQELSEDFIREFQDKVNWHSVSARQELSEDFIREFQDKVNWEEISFNQKLSEDFIREFQDKVVDREMLKMMVETAMFQLNEAEQNEKYVLEEAFTKEELYFCRRFLKNMYELYTEKNVKKFAKIVDKCTKDYR